MLLFHAETSFSQDIGPAKHRLAPTKSDFQNLADNDYLQCQKMRWGSKIYRLTQDTNAGQTLMLLICCTRDIMSWGREVKT